MGLGRYLVDAILLEGRSPSELATRHGISRSWIYELLQRYRQGGYAALEPGSHRPRSCPHQVKPKLVRTILSLRRELTAAGHDAGAQTIAHELRRRMKRVPSAATIWRILQRHGLITPQPHKRPRSSFTRFEAQLPNEMWQADATHWSLAAGRTVEILNLLDDHSRFLLASVAFHTIKAADVVSVFLQAGSAHGLPVSLLSDNAAVFSGEYRGGTVLLESELTRLGIRAAHARAYHPQTCGKVERFHQTLKRFLAKQPEPVSLAHLQMQLDTFRTYYNQRRAHRALGQRTPLVAFNGRLKARPSPIAVPTHFRVRLDKIDRSGRVTLRYLSVLRHIYVGRNHSGEREVTLDATRNYQPLRRAAIVHHQPRQASSIT